MGQRNASWKGQGVTHIAAELGTDTKTVKDDLGLAVTEAIEKALEAAETATTTRA